MKTGTIPAEIASALPAKTEARAEAWRAVRAWWRGMRFRRPVRRLRLCESLALGERRFVAVIEFERSRFLVGGTPNSLVLLTRLAEPTPGGADNADPESWAAKDQL